MLKILKLFFLVAGVNTVFFFIKAVHSSCAQDKWSFTFTEKKVTHWATTLPFIEMNFQQDSQNLHPCEIPKFSRKKHTLPTFLLSIDSLSYKSPQSLIFTKIKHRSRRLIHIRTIHLYQFYFITVTSQLIWNLKVRKVVFISFLIYFTLRYDQLT